MSGHQDGNVTRRQALGIGLGALGAAALTSRTVVAAEKKAKYKQGISVWCYRDKKMSMDDFCEEAKKIGFVALDLLGPGDFPTLKKHGLTCSMVNTTGIGAGLNDPKNHEMCVNKMREMIDAAAAEGYRNVITFSGNRNGMDDETGLKNSIEGAKKIAKYAEEKKVTVCLEYLNSINHKDYMADHTKWNVDFVKGVGSERVKVLYDIYHAGMMKEDPIADIKNHADCWGHYHTGGVPGRHELDAKQTLDYSAIMKAIAETGYDGYVVHEYTPTRNWIEGLKEAYAICDV
jgi:sugar phosphate isomerase/epimerase